MNGCLRFPYSGIQSQQAGLNKGRRTSNEKGASFLFLGCPSPQNLKQPLILVCVCLCGSVANLSMFESSLACEHHGHLGVSLVAGLDDLKVSHRPSRLDNGPDPFIDGHIHPIPERKEGV